MPVSIGIFTGDGATNPLVGLDLLLPDTNAAISVAGQVRAAAYAPGNNGSTAQPVSGTITPIVPTGSGTQYLLVTVAPLTGSLASSISTSAMPTPAAGTIAVAQQVVPSTVAANAVPSAQGGWTLVNQW